MNRLFYNLQTKIMLLTVNAMEIVFETETFERLRPFHFRTTHDTSSILLFVGILLESTKDWQCRCIRFAQVACEMELELFISFATYVTKGEAQIDKKGHHFYLVNSTVYQSYRSVFSNFTPYRSTIFYYV